MNPQHEQTSNGQNENQAQTPHSGAHPHELEVGQTPVHVADRPVSVFSSRRGAAPCRCIPQCPPAPGKLRVYHSFPFATFTLRQVDDYARSNGEAALLTEQVRALEPGTPEYAEAKSLLCAHAPAGVFNPFRAQRCMTVNGLAYCELDSAYDIATAREALEADPSIARAALSPGGKGFHVVVPVVPEPTNVPELQWALERVHGHMVCRYGALFEKIDRLTSGIDIHYLPSAPDALFQETALPLMPGAPPSRYTEERRRTVPGFGNGMAGGLGPFEDTTDPACLAWRDRTRRRIWTALEHLDLPDGSRNAVWIPTCFSLVGAELEGRALYAVSIGGRDLFGAWTRAAAYPGSTKPDEAENTFDRLSSEFDVDRAPVGSLEGLYARARAAGWDGRTAGDGDQASDDSDHESADDPEHEDETSDPESGGAADGADSAGRQKNAETEPPKRGRGRPKGSRNQAGSARQEKEERQDAETRAVSDYISGLKSSTSDIYWLGEYYTLRNGGWEQQSPEFYERKIAKRIGEARGTQTPVIGRYMSDCLATLQRELLPAVVDTGLLALENRLLNFHLDTGRLIDGTAFRNVCLEMDESGGISHQERGERDFYTTSRPYILPLEDPGRPQILDAWMEEMVPDEDTRQAVWECLGMSILGQGYAEQRVVFLCVGGRSGKGTLEKLAALLSGGCCSFSGGPARLGAGPFATSALVGNATCVLPDSPEMPEHPKSLTYAQYTLGLTTIKNLSGEDPITIEFKNDRRILSLIWPGTVWWDSNYPISKVIPNREDAHSWRGRIIPIPMTVEIDEDRQIRGFHERFTPEVPCIAYHAIRAYAERRRRGTFTFSPEMQKVLLLLGAGQFEHLQEIIAHLSPMPDAWTTREQIRGVAERILGRTAENKELNHLYSAAAAAGGRKTKRGGIQGFRDLDIVGEGDLEDGA